MRALGDGSARLFHCRAVARREPRQRHIGHRLQHRLRLADRRLQPPRHARVHLLQPREKIGHVLAHMAAGAEKERHDVDLCAAACGEACAGLEQARLHEFEIGQLDGDGRRRGAHAGDDILERQRPARIARTVGEQQQAALRHRYLTSQPNAASDSHR
jgi:hypothetical protein